MSRSADSDTVGNLEPMRHFAAVLTIVVAAAACASPASDGAPVATEIPAATTTSTAAPTTTAPSSDPSDAPCLAGNQPFSTSGVISAFGGAAGDARQISGIRTGFHPDCERIVVDLLTADGAPAGSLGLVGVEYEAAVGVVRINLPPAIVRTAVADLRLDGALADRAFLVATAAGNLALDIHIVPGSRIALRAFEVASPSRIVVDLKPEPSGLAASGAVFADRLVVTHPLAGAGTSPLRVTGYARASSASIRASLHEAPEAPATVTIETTTTASEEAWNEFALELPNQLSGMAHLQLAILPSETALVSVPVDLGPVGELDASDT